MNRFNIFNTPLADLKVIETKQLKDSRGFLSRLFCTEELSSAGWRKPIAQVNQTFTQKCGSIRGMHFQQPPYTEMKLVLCLSGAIWDVVVDIRAGSSTLLKFHAEELSEYNRRAILIPEGFAHGFQTLSDDCELVYFHSRSYAPNAEIGLNPQDPMLGINWPLSITEISIKDSQHPLINSEFKGINV
jgi:dTDP-4-dehydrorhamnose 3,5-epimerase